MLKYWSRHVCCLSQTSYPIVPHGSASKRDMTAGSDVRKTVNDLEQVCVCVFTCICTPTYEWVLTWLPRVSVNPALSPLSLLDLLYDCIFAVLPYQHLLPSALARSLAHPYTHPYAQPYARIVCRLTSNWHLPVTSAAGRGESEPQNSGTRTGARARGRRFRHGQWRKFGCASSRRRSARSVLLWLNPDRPLHPSQRRAALVAPATSDVGNEPSAYVKYPRHNHRKDVHNHCDLGNLGGGTYGA